MKTHIQRGFVVSLLMAAACGKSGSPWGGPGAGTGGDGAAGSGGAAVGDGTGGGIWLTPPVVPAALAVPAGAIVKVHGHAVGAQIYTCTLPSTADASAAWVLKAPEAILYDSAGAQLGTHGAGPSWTSRDGSTAIGVKAAQVDAPQSDAIPWLLLRISSTSGTGAFSDITYVQRLTTAGGRAPVTGCDATTDGMDLRVSYTGDYYLYTGGADPPVN